MNVVSKLKQLNTLPFPVTVKYYVAFDLPDASFHDNTEWSGNDWHILRDKHPRYRISDTRESWLADLSLDKDGQDTWLMERVKSLAALLEREKITTVYSISAGGGVFEYYLKKLAPHVKVIATEYTAEGVERLRRVCTELDEVRIFDALNAEGWKQFGNDSTSMVFINRNEREFSNSDWQQIFESMHKANVENVFLGLMWTLTARALLQIKWRNFMRRLQGRKLTFVGYIRSFEGLRRFWKGKYQEEEAIPFPTCTGLYLRRYTQPI